MYKDKEGRYYKNFIYMLLGIVSPSRIPKGTSGKQRQELKKRIKEVEKALNITLYACQKDFILNDVRICPNERCTGYTTAYCIKLLLTDGPPIEIWNYKDVENIMDDTEKIHREYFFHFFYEYYEKLKEKGVKIREVEIKNLIKIKI